MRKTLLRAHVLDWCWCWSPPDRRWRSSCEAANLVITTDGGFTPTTLPKKGFAPIKLHGYGKIATEDGSPPPVLETLTIWFDKHGEVETEGLPKCTPGETGGDDDGAGAQALPRRDRRHGLRQGRRDLPRTGADPGLLADHPVQRGAETRQPGRPRPRPPDGAGADHLRRPDRNPEGERRVATGSRPWRKSRRSPAAPASRSTAAHGRPRMELQRQDAELRQRRLPRRPPAGQSPSRFKDGTFLRVPCSNPARGAD